MRTPGVLVALIILTMTFIQCGNQDENIPLETTGTRGHIISSIITHEHYLREFMDSMMHNPQMHKQIHKMMMENDGGMMMHEMMKDDTVMRHSMMEHMMKMMEADSMMCGQMMRMMTANPVIGEQMKKAIEGVQDNLDHTKHHSPVEGIKKKDEQVHKH